MSDIGHYCRPCGENLTAEQATCPFCGQVAAPLDGAAARSSILMTEWGEYEVPLSVEAKIATYPKVKFQNPFTGEVSEYEAVDFGNPVLARYLGVVARYMERQRG